MTEITITDLAEQPTAFVREDVPMTDMTAFFSRVFPAVMAVLQEQGVAPAGPPFALYFGMPTDTVDVAAGFPVAGPIEPSGDVQPGTLPGGRTYQAVHVGPYDTLESTYQDVVARIAADGAAPADIMWEQYLSDPENEPDPAAWRTLVCWPVRP